MDSATMKLHVFCCVTSLEACDLQDAESDLADTQLTVVALPCSGKVDVPYLIKAFEAGAAGVVVVTCKQGDCHYIQGSFRAGNRSQAVDDLLDEIGLGRGRITRVSLDDRGVDGVIAELRTFRQSLPSLPTTTMKATC
ncbi:hydrogenase iron-sulfur subunit [Planctomycetota bacterium]